MAFRSFINRLPHLEILWPLPASTIAVSNLAALVLRNDGQWQRTALHESPCYIALTQNDRGIYDHYRNDVIGKHWPEVLPFSRTWGKYLELVASLRDRGFVYDAHAPVVVFKDNLLADGQHRMAALMHLHGGSLHLQLRRGAARLEQPIQWRLALLGQPCRVVVATAEQDATAV